MGYTGEVADDNSALDKDTSSWSRPRLHPPKSKADSIEVLEVYHLNSRISSRPTSPVHDKCRLGTVTTSVASVARIVALNMLSRLTCFSVQLIRLI